MHELSVAQNIVEIVTESAEKAGASGVDSVEIDIGTLSGVIPETLEFCWDISIKDTLLENSKLEIHRIEAVAKCNNCSKEFKIDDIYTLCKHCGSIAFEIIKGKELKVKSIKVK